MARCPLVAPLVTLLLVTCARSSGVAIQNNQLDAPPDSVYVEVINENFYDARVHAVYDGGHRHTLGTIHGNGGRREVALGWQPRPLTFEISFVIGGTAYVSYPVDVVRGDIVEVRLPPNIEASGFFRRVSGT